MGWDGNNPPLRRHAMNDPVPLFAGRPWLYWMLLLVFSIPYHVVEEMGYASWAHRVVWVW